MGSKLTAVRTSSIVLVEVMKELYARFANRFQHNRPTLTYIVVGKRQSVKMLVTVHTSISYPYV